MTDQPSLDAATFVLWLDASDGSIASHHGVRWPDGTATIHHRYHRGLTATHSSPEAACQSVYGKQGRIVWDNARTTQDNPVASYPHRDGEFTVLGPEIFASSDGAVICWKGENYVRQGDPAATDEGLRELYAAAIVAKVDGTRGCANGYRLADAVLAVRDTELTEWRDLAKSALKDVEQQTERGDDAGAVLVQIREYVEHSDDDAIRTRENVLRILDGPADTTPPDPLAALHIWLSAEAAHHHAAVPHCRTPEGGQAHGGMGAGLDIAARVVEGLIAGRGLPVSGGVKPEAAGE